MHRWVCFYFMLPYTLISCLPQLDFYALWIRYYLSVFSCDVLKVFRNALDLELRKGFFFCILAYIYPDPNRIKAVENHVHSDSESFEEISESDLLELQAHKSPISDTSDTLTYGSLSSQPEENKEQKFSPPELPSNGNNNASNNSSQKYVSDFLERYALGNF